MVREMKQLTSRVTQQSNLYKHTPKQRFYTVGTLFRKGSWLIDQFPVLSMANRLT